MGGYTRQGIVALRFMLIGRQSMGQKSQGPPGCQKVDQFETETASFEKLLGDDQ